MAARVMPLGRDGQCARLGLCPCLYESLEEYWNAGAARRATELKAGAATTGGAAVPAHG